MKDVNILLANGVNVKKSLELFGDMETYDETLEDFLTDIDGRLEELKKYKEVADMGNYSILVHALKSDMRYFGFDELGEMCYQHELESKANNIYYIYEHYDELVRGLKNMIRIAKEYFGKITTVELERSEPINTPSDCILVVDDSNIIQKFIEKIFSNQYHVLIAKDGEEAMRMVENKEYHIVGMLLDLNMPNVNGFVVLNYLQQQNLFDTLPVSIITGVGNEEIVNQAFMYPIIDVLRKPFNERDIKTVVEKTVAKER